jgi:RHS repeat-associated protein
MHPPRGKASSAVSSRFPTCRRPASGARNLFTGFCGAISGQRYYNPSTGRWLNRDPLDDAELLPEGPNLNSFGPNTPLFGFDYLGLNWVPGSGGFAGGANDRGGPSRGSPVEGFKWDTGQYISIWPNYDPRGGCRDSSGRYSTPAHGEPATGTPRLGHSGNFVARGMPKGKEHLE